MINYFFQCYFLTLAVHFQSIKLKLYWHGNKLSTMRGLIAFNTHNVECSPCIGTPCTAYLLASICIISAAYNISSVSPWLAHLTSHFLSSHLVFFSNQLYTTSSLKDWSSLVDCFIGFIISALAWRSRERYSLQKRNYTTFNHTGENGCTRKRLIVAMSSHKCYVNSTH